MTATRYRKKPVVIEAQQWNGSVGWATVIIDWILSHGGTATYREPQERLVAGNGELAQQEASARLRIRTLEGDIFASPGDWIIKGVQGEFYPCKPDIFEATYKPDGTLPKGSYDA